ncbi:MAG: hypothetical protein OER92_00650 [Alphaproteobacteria bacterium]|nr:hypothetical protein [Alphaproteobacteria bacterium]
MIKTLIPVVVLLLIGGVPDAFAQPTLQATPVAEKSAPASSDENIYLKLPPITSTIFRRDLPAGTFTVAITLQISDEQVRTEIIAERRRLRDSMFRELHAMFEREEYTGRKVNVDAVKQRMLVITQRQFGPDVVLDVFVNALSRRGA